MEIYRKAARSLISRGEVDLAKGQVLHIDTSVDVDIGDVLKQVDIGEPLNPNHNVMETIILPQSPIYS